MQLAEPALEEPGVPLRSERPLALTLRLIQFGPGVILAALFLTMTLLSPFFLTGENMQNLGTQSSIVAALAIGQLFVIIARGIDVSVGAVLAFSAVLPATLFGGSDGFAFVLIGLSAGLAVGALILGTIRNGLALLNVVPFWQTVAVGCVVLVALELDVIRGQLENRLRVSQATEH